MTWFEEALADQRLAPNRIGMLELAPRLLWRVYPGRYGAAGFNGSGLGSARFSPLQMGGAIIPTLYAGTTLDVALMETVWHDAPSPAHGFHLVLNEAIEPRRVGSLRPSAPLRLVDLTAVGLRRLGLSRSNVIDSEPADYPVTRQFSAWLYDMKPEAQGFCWISRQDDAGKAVVLFEPRLATVRLAVETQGEVFTAGPHLDVLLALAERMGAGVIIR